VAQAPNRLSLFCRYGLVSPMGAETFFGDGCLVGIGFGDFFQFECLSTTLLLGSIIQNSSYRRAPTTPESNGKFDLTSWFP
jgi:hypothetical protein